MATKTILALGSIDDEQLSPLVQSLGGSNAVQTVRIETFDPRGYDGVDELSENEEDAAELAHLDETLANAFGEVPRDRVDAIVVGLPSADDLVLSEQRMPMQWVLIAESVRYDAMYQVTPKIGSGFWLEQVNGNNHLG